LYGRHWPKAFSNFRLSLSDLLTPVRLFLFL
jgi:hypothetical protein